MELWTKPLQHLPNMWKVRRKSREAARFFCFPHKEKSVPWPLYSALYFCLCAGTLSQLTDGQRCAVTLCKPGFSAFPVSAEGTIPRCVGRRCPGLGGQ